jgi:hypothetical protein
MNSRHDTSKFSIEMIELYSWHDLLLSLSLSLSLEQASILQRVKEGYLLWMSIVPHIAKGARYTIGARIENKFLDLLDLTYRAYFTPKEHKMEKISECIFLRNTLAYLISVAWSGKLISNQHYESVALKLEEIGKMFGGWKGSLNNPSKKNRPAAGGTEKK